MPTATPLKKVAAAAAPLAEDYTLRLCEQLARWRYEDLPAEVVRMLKFFLLDTLGVIAGAANAPGIRELNQRLSKWESGGSATGAHHRHHHAPRPRAVACRGGVRGSALRDRARPVL